MQTLRASIAYTVPGTNENPIKDYENKVLRDPAFMVRLYDKLGSDLAFKSLEESQGPNGPLLTRVMEIHPRPEIVPGLVRATLGAKAMAYKETFIYDVNSHKAQRNLEMLNSTVRNVMDVKNTVELKGSDEADKQRTVFREINTTLKVNIPLMGGRIAKSLIGLLENKANEMRDAAEAIWQEDAQSQDVER